MTNLDPAARFTYLGMEAVIIGSVVLFVVVFHFPILQRRWRALLLTTVLVTLYGSALDAWAIQNGWGWFNPARHLTRYREIATILAKHGLGWVIVQVGLGDLVPFQRGLLGHAPRETPYTQAEHFRMAFEELGAAFIKFGQILSTRADLLSPAYVAEFSKLQDAAPPVPYDEIAGVIEHELGAPPEIAFADFEHTPRASASISQAHAAQLENGARVIVKVQCPHVAALIERDLEVLADLAQWAARHTQATQYYDLVGLVEEFGYNLRNELDYTREGQNADRIRRNFADEPALYVPQVHWDYSTPRVLTLEEIRGVKINDLAALDAAGLDRHRVAENSVRIMLTEVFEHVFFTPIRIRAIFS